MYKIRNNLLHYCANSYKNLFPLAMLWWPKMVRAWNTMSFVLLTVSLLEIIHVLMLSKIVVVFFFFLGHHAPKHLLRCENPNTFYVTCPETGRHSLKIPLDAPQGTLTIKCSYTAWIIAEVVALRKCEVNSEALIFDDICVIQSFLSCLFCNHTLKPFVPSIRMHNLHTVLYTFCKVLTMRISFAIKSCFSWW